MIRYRTVQQSGPISIDDLNQQWREGYELITAVASDERSARNGAAAFDPDPVYVYYFAYRGGVRAPRSVGGSGS